VYKDYHKTWQIISLKLLSCLINKYLSNIQIVSFHSEAITFVIEKNTFKKSRFENYVNIYALNKN